MNISSLFSNIRFYILLFSALLAGVIYFSIDNIATKTQFYALTAVSFLYLTLMASPVTRIFTFLPYRGLYLKGRRALGVSAFLFALLHAKFAFFDTIGGFGAFFSLPSNMQTGVLLGGINLTILFLMAATAFDFMVAKLSFAKWKALHRLVYLVAIFTIFHALLLGSHFSQISSLIPRIFFTAFGILLALELIRFNIFLKSKITTYPKSAVNTIIVVIILIVLVVYHFYPW